MNKIEIVLDEKEMNVILNSLTITAKELASKIPDKINLHSDASVKNLLLVTNLLNKLKENQRCQHGSSL